MMKKIMIMFCMLPLMGCPYIETYRHYGNSITADSVEYNPLTFFYNDRKKIVDGHIVLKVGNKGAVSRIIHIDSFYLIVNSNRIILQDLDLRVEDQFQKMKFIRLPAAKDTVLSLVLRDSAYKFRGDLKLFVKGSPPGSSLYYDRLPKNSAFFWSGIGAKKRAANKIRN